VLQATIGCSYNHCTFCGMYRHKRFRVRRLADLKREIEHAGAYDPGVTRVFLADGDALVAPPRFLDELLAAIRAAFPRLDRVSCYASPQALQLRTIEQMQRLRDAGLKHYYLGVESGHDDVLERLAKGVDAVEMVRVGRKAVDAGVSLSTMILLGAGGRRLSFAHARASALLLNRIQPDFASTLVMTPVPGTPLWEQDLQGEFESLDSRELTQELRAFVAHLELDDTVFRANHASNHLVLAGRLPRDKRAVLRRLDEALGDATGAAYVPAAARGL